MNFLGYLCIINFFLQKINKMHTAIRIRYPDIREDLSEKISGYSISEQNIRIRIRYPEKSPDIRKFHLNQCSPSSNPDPDGYFPNHITSLLPFTMVCELYCSNWGKDLPIIFSIRSRRDSSVQFGFGVLGWPIGVSSACSTVWAGRRCRRVRSSS
jgi:hypothetical protein